MPQGAAPLSLAVFESDGRKREVVIDNVVNWGVERAEAKPRNAKQRSVRQNVTARRKNERVGATNLAFALVDSEVLSRPTPWKSVGADIAWPPENRTADHYDERNSGHGE